MARKPSARWTACISIRFIMPVLKPSTAAVKGPTAIRWVFTRPKVKHFLIVIRKGVPFPPFKKWFLFIFFSFLLVAWFTFDMTAYPAETRLSPDGLTATTDSYEPRVLLSSVGFSRGVHYWEFTVDRYDGAADPAFGVARRDVARDSMLGILKYSKISVQK